MHTYLAAKPRSIYLTFVLLLSTASRFQSIAAGMAVREVQVFKLGVESQFAGLSRREQRYAHHLARYDFSHPPAAFI